MDKEITLDNLLKFLCGEESINGRWFGEYYDGEPSFWWRPELKRLIEAYVTTRVKEAERQMAVATISAFVAVMSAKVEAKQGRLSKEEVQHWLKHIHAELMDGTKNIVSSNLTTTTNRKEEKV